ncbi:MAG TPA: hypothetical protein P5519_07245 [Spirochaetia bacterium]|nr:hypothetical protein [Spirochaetales bacterium]HPD79925.1 hypothetical protein [Spirochaetales bacterium]HRS65668.1 hypothetical protein [Spirochaetia bacterium]HRV27258.1 hypothetical protein [Spirochaetia bacterium]
MNKNILFFLFMAILLLFSIYFTYFSEHFSKKTVILENNLDSSFQITPYDPFSYSTFLNLTNTSSDTMILFSKDYQSGILFFKKNYKLENIYVLHNMATFFVDSIDINVLKTEQSQLYKLIK